jgi:type VI secretion system secreted protein Hcp
MKIRYNTRLVVLLGILIGITTLSMLIVSFGQHVNASTLETQYPSFNSISMNLFYEGVDGESIISGRENSITVLGYSHSISNPYDLATGDLTVKKHSPLRVMKYVDKSTPKLYEKCVKGVADPSVILKFYFEPSGLNFYTIELINAKITSVQGYGTISVNEVPRETVSFTYETIKWTYTEYDAEGKSKGNVEAQDDWINAPG